MPDIEKLLVKFLSNFGVDPTAGDVSGEARPEEARPWLGSPYKCEPTTWGIEETPAPEPTPDPAATLKRAARLPPSPAAAARRRQGNTKPARPSSRCLRLTVHREPPPRGLMSS